MNGESKILLHHSKLSSSFLHAKGKSATNLLIRHLNCQPGEKILEIGFGTGATLAILAKKFRQSKFFGAEYSKEMFDKAVSRLKFCDLYHKISLTKINIPNILPFEDNSFDKIYIESVLAIQIDESLPKMLKEIKRVLKPGGLMVMNETLWLDTVPLSRIMDFNQRCLTDFGIIQANSMYPYLKSWTALLESMNFEIVFTQDLNTIDANTVNVDYTNWLSQLFTIIGKLGGKFNLETRKNERLFEENMKALATTDEILMAGYLIVARLTK